MHEKQLWLYTVTAYQLSYQENTRSDVWCFDKWRKACYAKHELDLAKHKRYSIPIGPNEVMRYDVTYFFRLFVWPNIISDGLTNELSKRIKKQLRWHGCSSFTTCAEGPVCRSGQLQTKDINAPFRKISNSAQCGKFALILWRLVKGSFFCVF